MRRKWLPLACIGAMLCVAPAAWSASPCNGPTLTLDPGGGVPSGAPFRVQWSGIQTPTSRDWIGLYFTGTVGSPAPDPPADDEYLSWFYLGSCSHVAGPATPGGTCDVRAPLNHGIAGSVDLYELRMFADNGFQKLADAILQVGKPYQVSLSTDSFWKRPQEKVTVRWSGIDWPSPRDWIGLYEAGSMGNPLPGPMPDRDFIEWFYVGSCAREPGVPAAAGSCEILAPSALISVTQENYELRLFANNSYARLADARFAVTMEHDPHLDVVPETAAAGSTVEVEWHSLRSPTPHDWIGVYGLAEIVGAHFDWFYIGTCSKTPGMPYQSGSCSYTIPLDREHEHEHEHAMLLHANDGYGLLARDPFVVTAPTPASLTLGASGAPAGDPVTVHWTGVATPSPRDWIGLYHVGTHGTTWPPPPTDQQFLDWFYAGSCTRVPGLAKAEGCCSFNAPPGLATVVDYYELRMFTNDGWERLAVSDYLGVAGAGIP